MSTCGSCGSPTVECNIKKTLTGTARDASESTQERRDKAIYFQLGPNPAVIKFKSYAERLAYFRGREACCPNINSLCFDPSTPCSIED